MLAQSAIVEVPAGAGRVLFLQALAGSKFDVEPAARRTLQNAIDYLAVPVAAPGRTVVLGADEPFFRALEEIGVDATVVPSVSAASLNGAGLVVLDGAACADDIAVAAEFARGGGTVYWHEPDSGAFEALCAEIGTAGASVVASQGPVTVTGRAHPLLRGVSREDLLLLASAGGWDRRMTVDPDAIDRALALPDEGVNADVLTSPAALVSLKVGEGRVVVDCIRWDTNERDVAKARRYASALFANLGAAWRSQMEADAEWLPLEPFKPVEAIPYFWNNGSELAFFSGGTVAAPFEVVRAGRYAVVVRARSNAAGGEYGRVAVGVDDAPVIEREVRTEQVADFEVGEVRLTSGGHELTVSYTNDGQVDGVDRNLWITGLGLRRVEEGQ